MADDVWSRPRIPTGQSVAAALRLAKELDPDASLLCEGRDGSTELLVRQSGYVDRYIAYSSGATEHVERRGRTRKDRVGTKLMRGGFAAIPVILAAGFGFQPQNAAVWIGVPSVLAWVLVVGGGLLRARFDPIDVPDDAVSARIPHDLDGWQPTTVAQLAAVERLSDESDAGVRVQNVADGVAVVTYRKRQRRRHVLDAYGAIVEQDTSIVAGRIYWTVKLAALCIVIPFAAIFFFDSVRYFFLGFGLYSLIIVLAWRVDARKHPGRAGEEWFAISVEPPSD
jgi:hypothetical protein